MRIALDIPDDIAAILNGTGEDLSRATLEALGIEAYRRRQISAYQLRTMLGMDSRFELDAFLKEHRVETYTVDDFESDWATIQARPGARRPA